MTSRLIFSLLVFFLGTSFISAQISDDFADGDFTNNPTWLGDTETFVVNTGGELQSDDTVTSTSQLYVAANTTGQTTWEFLVRLDFSPSTSNFAKVYLHSDSPDLEGDLNGYYLKIGGISGSDDAVELFRQDGSDDELLIAGMTGGAGTSTVVVRVRVIRDDAGNWELFTDYTGGEAYTSEGTALDNTHLIGNYFGFFCKYTSTRGKLFFLDDVLITPTFEDETPPELLNVNVVNSTTIIANFNEILDPITTVPSNFSLNNGLSIVDAELVIGNAAQVQIGLLDPMQNLQTYTLTAFDIADLAGNILTEGNADFYFLQAEQMTAGDIVINELLPNPISGGVDFLEIYNKSDKVLAINELKIANRQKETGDTMQAITDERFILPGEYLVLTDNPDHILDHFTVENPDHLVEQNLPSFDDKEGNVTLFTDDFIMDSFDYSDDLHYALLRDFNGVSLERLDINTPTNSTGNWYSAAATAGYGTPTATNSQFTPTGQAPEEFFTIENARVSPDEDGFEDVLVMQYALASAGFTANIRVFDAEGRLIKELANNQLLATNGTLKWDGTTDNLQRARIGIYVVWFEIFSPQGATHYQKEPIVVAGKL